MSATTSDRGPSGMPPPGYARTLTVIVVGGMLANWSHWIGLWLLATLAGTGA